MILAFLPRRTEPLQKLFFRNFDQIPPIAVPQRPLPIDYVPTFFLLINF